MKNYLKIIRYLNYIENLIEGIKSREVKTTFRDIETRQKKTEIIKQFVIFKKKEIG